MCVVQWLRDTAGLSRIERWRQRGLLCELGCLRRFPLESVLHVRRRAAVRSYFQLVVSVLLERERSVRPTDGGAASGPGGPTAENFAGPLGNNATAAQDRGASYGGVTNESAYASSV